jgi:hypothetical protein
MILAAANFSGHIIDGIETAYGNVATAKCRCSHIIDRVETAYANVDAT